MNGGVNIVDIHLSQRKLEFLSDDVKNELLSALSKTIKENKVKILQANQKDLEIALRKNISEAFLQRLRLDKSGVDAIVKRLDEVKKLTCNLGEIIEQRNVASGLLLRKVRVPLGVILVIYEARPEVTIDVTALCIKSGNAVILKGGSEALLTNRALFFCIQKVLEKFHIENTVTFLDTHDRKVIWELLRQNNKLDLVIARGGYTMVKSILSKSKIPVLAHAAGGSRIYVDSSADIKKAIKIICNAKISKPAACNSLDTVLIHKDIVQKVLPQLVKVLEKKSVIIIGDKKSRSFVKIGKATKKDYSIEFLGLKIVIKIVDSIDEAIVFIDRYGKMHSEGIIAQDEKAIKQFVGAVDSAGVFINCSTRFHDGFEFGLGSEMGIATGKLHARGPVGIKELTTYKWEVYGNGQIRK